MVLPVGFTTNPRALTPTEIATVEDWLSSRKDWVKTASLAAVLRELQNDEEAIDEACGAENLKKAIETWAKANSVTFPKKSKNLHVADLNVSGLGNILKTGAGLVSNGIQFNPWDTQITATKSGLAMRPWLGSTTNPGLHYKFGGAAKLDIHTANKDTYHASYDPSKKTAGAGYMYTPGNLTAGGSASYNIDTQAITLSLSGSYKSVHVKMAITKSNYTLSLSYPKSKSKKLSYHEIERSFDKMTDAGNRIFDALAAHDALNDPKGFQQIIKDDISTMSKGMKDVQGLMDFYGKNRSKVAISGSLDFNVGDFTLPSYAIPPGSPPDFDDKLKNSYFIGGSLHIIF